ncbi:MAG TPA: hypothetical protein VK574_13020 [Terracidiphilus sp.]|nr:hypothetical protein [Terracidiphilus sp.]
MSTAEFPAPGPNAGINSQMEFKRAIPRVLRNSRILCWITVGLSIAVAFMGVCMLLMVFSLLFLQGSFSFGNLIAAMQWGVGALSMLLMCRWVWNRGRAMAEYRVKLESRGITFNLGTKKKPSDLFLPWDQITAITRRRIGNRLQFSVEAKDGSEATFSSFTFFRPMAVARQIAERAGLGIQILK